MIRQDQGDRIDKEPCQGSLYFTYYWLGGASQRAALSVVSPKKETVDFNVPLLKFRLQKSVVVMFIEGHNVISVIDRYPIYGQPPNAFYADFHQIPAFDRVGQTFNKSFFTNDCEAFARNREDAVQMEDAGDQRDSDDIVLSPHYIFQPSVTCLV